MVDDVKEHILNSIRKKPALGTFVIDAFLEIIGTGDDTEGIPLVVVMDIAQSLYIMELPYLEFRCAALDPGVPDMVRVEDMAEQLQTFFGHVGTLGVESLDQFFIAIKIIIEERVEKRFHELG